MRKFDILTKFYEKTKTEKLSTLYQEGWLTKTDMEVLKSNIGLTDDIANQMVENQLGLYQLPFAVALNFLIDQEEVIIPMVTEEPSVVAAASHAAKIMARSGGIQTTQTKRQMIGQIALTEVADIPKAIAAIHQQRDTLFEIANQAYPSIVKRDGGIREIECKTATYDQSTFLVIYVYIDTGEAMGANMVNTILEALVTPLETLSNGQSVMAILSNKATESLATAICTIAPELLATQQFSGEAIRDQIVLASHFASADTYRATTHNKGIMNGVNAVVMATGNDWRAIEAGAHAFASHNGAYSPLATWSTDQDGNLVGTITLPVAIGTVGGSISIHPMAQLAHRLMKKPSASRLACIIAAVGLAQNFAALKALVSDGIQKGHMRLHARSLALSVGAAPDEVDQVVQLLLKNKPFNQETAQHCLTTVRNRKVT